MRRYFGVIAIAALLAGCATDTRQANFRQPRPDELRPGDVAPMPGPMPPSPILNPGVAEAPRPLMPYLPPPYQVPVYQMQPIPQQKSNVTNCTTQRIANTLQTQCY